MPTPQKEKEISTHKRDININPQKEKSTPSSKHQRDILPKNA